MHLLLFHPSAAALVLFSLVAYFGPAVLADPAHADTVLISTAPRVFHGAVDHVLLMACGTTLAATLWAIKRLLDRGTEVRFSDFALVLVLVLLTLAFVGVTVNTLVDPAPFRFPPQLV